MSSSSSATSRRRLLVRRNVMTSHDLPYVTRHSDQRFLFVKHIWAQDQLERLQVEHDGLVSKFEQSRKSCRLLHLMAQDQLERLQVEHDGLVSKFEQSRKSCRFMKIMIACMVVVFMGMKM
ncbi:hypothetical protein Tco_0378946 [Tanacetum coccineum]